MDLSDAIIFKNPAKINAGSLALETIPLELIWRGASHPLLLLDATCRSVEKQIAKSFQGSQTALLIHHMDRQLPIPDAIVKLVHSYKTNGCDSIIVSGSPELLDIARLLNLAVSQEDPSTLNDLVVTDHLKPLVAVISDSGQALHLTESAIMEGHRFEAIKIMPSLVIIDDRLAGRIQWQSCLPDALAALTLASETLAFGQTNRFHQVYAHSALKAIVNHLPSVLLKTKARMSKTSLLGAELFAGLSTGPRNHHPSWALANQVAAQTTLPMGMVAALMLPSVLAQAKAVAKGRPDMLMTALGGDGFYSKVCANNLDPWDETLECLHNFFDHIRSLKPGNFPKNLHRSGLGIDIDRLDAMATEAAGKLDGIWDVPDLGKILKHTVLIQSAAVA